VSYYVTILTLTLAAVLGVVVAKAQAAARRLLPGRETAGAPPSPLFTYRRRGRGQAGERPCSTNNPGRQARRFNPGGASGSTRT
jgi:hypothetical protein